MSGRVLLFGSYDAALHPRVAVLRDGLAAHGWQVDELNAPLGAATADKVAAAGSPRAAARLLGRQARAWRALLAGSRGLPTPEVVVVGYMGHADVHLARALFRRSLIVLDHLVGLADTVSDRRLGGPVTRRSLDLVDRAALRAADLVVVDTPQQAATLPGWARDRAVVVPVGAGADWFAAGERAAAARTAHPGPPDQPLRIVFFGLFTPLQGAATIGRAVSLLADVPLELTLVGHGQDHAEVRALVGTDPRVRWRDWVDPAELPDLVAGHDVCLGIFGTGSKAQRVVPTKVYQGMAAGCAVVTGATEAVRPLGGAVLAVPPGDPHALARVLRHLATDREALTMARRRARSAADGFGPRAATAGLAARLRRGRPSAPSDDGDADPGRRAADADEAPGVGPTSPARVPPLTLNAWLRWDVIARELDRLDGRDVLEIGPGEGAAACRLAQGRRYTGVEPSPRTRAITERRLAAQGTPGRLVGSLADLDPGETFDLVCAFEVIEHLEDDRTALAEWVARVRPGGTLMLSTPSGPDRMGPWDAIAGHYRRYDPEDLAALARGAGLPEVRVLHVGFPVGYALEAIRNAVARRRLAGQADPGAGDLGERTEGSSSLLQPRPWMADATRMASAPARWMQRLRPDRGPGLVLVGRAGP